MTNNGTETITDPEREVMRILREMPPQYHRAWLRAGARILMGVPTARVGNLFRIECAKVDYHAGG